jgi:hypothetical protein
LKIQKFYLVFLIKVTQHPDIRYNSDGYISNHLKIRNQELRVPKGAKVRILETTFTDDGHGVRRQRGRVDLEKAVKDRTRFLIGHGPKTRLRDVEDVVLAPKWAH